MGILPTLIKVLQSRLLVCQQNTKAMQYYNSIYTRTFAVMKH